MQVLVAQQATFMEDQLRRRIAEIDQMIAKLQRERKIVEERLQKLLVAPVARPASGVPLVTCPKCGRDRDFLTDAGGYLAHVLEEPGDTELLDSGKALFCPKCGEVFLYQKSGAAKKKR